MPQHPTSDTSSTSRSPRPGRARRDRVRNRRQSVRQASAGIRTALAELPAGASAQAARVPISSRARPIESEPVALARASNPVQFSTTAGRLRTTLFGASTTGVARHEVAHLLGAGHPAISAATKGTGFPKTGVQTAQSARFETDTRLRRQRLTRIKGKGSQSSSRMFVGKPGTMRAKFAEFGKQSSARGRQVRRQSLNLAFKLRKAGRDF